MSLKPPAIHVQTAKSLSGATPASVPRVVTTLRTNGSTVTMGFSNEANMTIWLSQQVDIDEVTSVR